ncbi:MAG: hypothetical protein EOP79_04775 [Variovorax sp.]|nr:MAG: hypothetical protein EOP79_04775 [Variovorax sp.]
MATSPDLPSPITPDLPNQPDPSDLPVEPDQGMVTRFRSERRFAGARWTVHFLANRQYMGAARYTWPTMRTSAWVF